MNETHFNSRDVTVAAILAAFSVVVITFLGPYINSVTHLPGGSAVIGIFVFALVLVHRFSEKKGICLFTASITGIIASFTPMMAGVGPQSFVLAFIVGIIMELLYLIGNEKVIFDALFGGIAGSLGLIFPSWFLGIPLAMYWAVLVGGFISGLIGGYFGAIISKKVVIM